MTFLSKKHIKFIVYVYTITFRQLLFGCSGHIPVTFGASTVDASEILLTTWDGKNPISNGINYQPELVNTGFLNHQQQ